MEEEGRNYRTGEYCTGVRSTSYVVRAALSNLWRIRLKAFMYYCRLRHRPINQINIYRVCMYSRNHRVCTWSAGSRIPNGVCLRPQPDLMYSVQHCMNIYLLLYLFIYYGIRESRMWSRRWILGVHGALGSSSVEIGSWERTKEKVNDSVHRKYWKTKGV